MLLRTVLLCLVAIFGVFVTQPAAAQDDQPQRGRGQGQQKQDELPNWIVGTFRGQNRFRNTSMEVIVAGNGKVSVNVGLRRIDGVYRPGRLEMSSGNDWNVRYVEEDTIDLTNADDRRDAVRLRRIGSRIGPATDLSLNVTSPRPNQRVPQGPVRIEGTTIFTSVFVEIMEGRRSIYRDTLGVRSGRFATTVRLDNGHYDLTVRGRSDRTPERERHFSFDVMGGQATLKIDRPKDGDRFTQGDVRFEGSSNADNVQIEVNRDRDRVWLQTVAVRNGRFSSAVQLGFGHYDATITARVDGRAVASQRFSFDVGSNELRIDRPVNNGRVGNAVDIEGAAGTPDVRVEVFSGRNRIYNQTIAVVNGRYRIRVQLANGKYDLVVSGIRNGKALAERRIKFEVRG